MKPSLYHIQLRVSDFKKSFRFYDRLFRYFGWKKIHGGKGWCGWGSGHGDVWIVQTEKGYQRPKFHRKRSGLNHIAFRVGTRREVDRFYKHFLVRRNIPILYGGPKEYPEYAKGYYAVFFEDPDRIKVEVAHIPFS